MGQSLNGDELQEPIHYAAIYICDTQPKRKILEGAWILHRSTDSTKLQQYSYQKGCTYSMKDWLADETPTGKCWETFKTHQIISYSPINNDAEIEKLEKSFIADRHYSETS